MSDLSKETLIPVAGIGEGFFEEEIFELDLQEWIENQEAGVAGEDFQHSRDLEALGQGEFRHSAQHSERAERLLRSRTGEAGVQDFQKGVGTPGSAKLSLP